MCGEPGVWKYSYNFETHHIHKQRSVGVKRRCLVFMKSYLLINGVAIDHLITVNCNNLECELKLNREHFIPNELAIYERIIAALINYINHWYTHNSKNHDDFFCISITVFFGYGHKVYVQFEQTYEQDSLRVMETPITCPWNVRLNVIHRLIVNFFNAAL